MSTATPTPPSFSPGPYVVDNGDSAIFGVFDANGDAIAYTSENMRTPLHDYDTDHANAHLLAASWQLYAYAKAEAKRQQWVDSARGTFEDSDAVETRRLLDDYERFLSTLGWSRNTPAVNFLAAFRDKAVAKAEGGAA